jgi:1-acyl-sn-glycerol-3-phosphate acyltransferase
MITCHAPKKSIDPSMLRFAVRLILRALGWRMEGEAPQISKYVLIAAPHTSNWDFPLMLAARVEFGVHAAWMGKDTLFRWPFGTLLRALGGIPVDRTSPRNAVEQISAAILHAERIVVAIPPEGTRKRAEYWKSGFYHIAQSAQVPIVLTYLDYGRKCAGFGPVLDFRLPVNALMAEAREFYRTVTPKFPDRFGPVRLRQEEFHG